MKNVLCKVYAAFSPAGKPVLEAVSLAAQGAIGSGDPWLFLEGDMLRISFEGMYFPVDEVIAVLTGLLPAGSEGKLDYLDMEEWRLLRYVFAGEGFTASERSLNHVLDYSGH